jgi:hypothetical protein
MCGRDSDDIHRLSPDGTFRDIVLSEHDGVDKPLNITFNNDFTKLSSKYKNPSSTKYKNPLSTKKRQNIKILHLQKI